MGKDKKNIAVLVRDRQAEALRMAIGLTLTDDRVDVFIMDKELLSDTDIQLNIETLNEMRVKIFSNNTVNPFHQMSTQEIADKLTEYDVVIPY